MMITEYNSVKIRWLSFGAILCVVLGHCVSGDGILERLIMGIFAQWHVPWFYVVSGSMLSYSIERHTLQACCSSRLKKLVLPYFLWCVIGFLVVGVLGGNQASIGEWLGIGTAFPAGNPHLWYLHCLIVFSFTSILVWKLVGLISTPYRLVSFSLVYCVIVALAIVLRCTTLYGTPTSPLYFLVGFIVARCILGEAKRSSVALFCITLAIAVGLRCGWFLFDTHSLMEQVVRMLCIFAQIVALWVGYDFAVAKFNLGERCCCVPWCVNSVFFVYCAHGFILNTLKQLGLSGDILLFIATIALTLFLAWVVRRFALMAYLVLTGGR